MSILLRIPSGFFGIFEAVADGREKDRTHTNNYKFLLLNKFNDI